jgi:hypothetical protein
MNRSAIGVASVIALVIVFPILHPAWVMVK